MYWSSDVDASLKTAAVLLFAAGVLIGAAVVAMVWWIAT